MTKKDCEAIAKCIKDEWTDKYLDPNDAKNRAIFSLHKRIADVFKADNPKFNRDRFEKDCGF